MQTRQIRHEWRCSYRTLIFFCICQRWDGQYTVAMGYRLKEIGISLKSRSLTFSLTLCGLASQKTHRGGLCLGLGGSVHEEAHSSFPCFIQPSFKGTDARSIYYPLVQLIPSINHSIWKKYLQQFRVHRKLTSFLDYPLIPLALSAC